MKQHPITYTILTSSRRRECALRTVKEPRSWGGIQIVGCPEEPIFQMHHTSYQPKRHTELGVYMCATHAILHLTTLKGMIKIMEDPEGDIMTYLKERDIHSAASDLETLTRAQLKSLATALQQHPKFAGITKVQVEILSGMIESWTGDFDDCLEAARLLAP